MQLDDLTLKKNINVNKKNENMSHTGFEHGISRFLAKRANHCTTNLLVTIKLFWKLNNYTYYIYISDTMYLPIWIIDVKLRVQYVGPVAQSVKPLIVSRVLGGLARARGIETRPGLFENFIRLSLLDFQLLTELKVYCFSYVSSYYYCLSPRTFTL